VGSYDIRLLRGRNNFNSQAREILMLSMDNLANPIIGFDLIRGGGYEYFHCFLKRALLRALIEEEGRLQ
jgi:hypothetical protein